LNKQIDNLSHFFHRIFPLIKMAPEGMLIGVCFILFFAKIMADAIFQSFWVKIVGIAVLFFTLGVYAHAKYEMRNERQPYCDIEQ